ncbi:MAG: CpaE family protein [Comamonas sp.]
MKELDVSAFLSATPTPHTDEAQKPAQRRIVVASQDAADADWLQMRIGHAIQVQHCSVGVDAVLESLRIPASAVVVVFDARADLGQASQVVSWLHKHRSEIVVLGMGYTTSAQVPLAALRAGVKDFLDINATNPEDIRKPVWDACMKGAVEREAPVRGKVVALVGARAGMGVTTLAVHVAAAIAAIQEQRRAKLSTAYELTESTLGVGLMDLGFPLRDGQMLLGLNGRFHMVDAVHGVNRLDKALLEATLPRHTSGVSVLSWPAQSHVLREVSPLSTAAMLQRLRSFFAWQVVDVGGFPSMDVVQEMMAEADLVWMVSDQSIGGIVSTSDLLKHLRSNTTPASVDGLIVNRAFKGHGLPAADIAKRLELPLVQVLPHREEALLRASSAGFLLSESAPADAYCQGVRQIAKEIFKEEPGGGEAPPIGWWRRWVGKGPLA